MHIQTCTQTEAQQRVGQHPLSSNEKQKKSCYLGNCLHTSSGGPRFPVCLRLYCFGCLLIAAASLDGLSHRWQDFILNHGELDGIICADRKLLCSKSPIIGRTPKYYNRKSVQQFEGLYLYCYTQSPSLATTQLPRAEDRGRYA